MAHSLKNIDSFRKIVLPPLAVFGRGVPLSCLQAELLDLLGLLLHGAVEEEVRLQEDVVQSAGVEGSASPVDEGADAEPLLVSCDLLAAGHHTHDDLGDAGVHLLPSLVLAPDM